MQIIVSNAEILVLLAPERPKVTGMILDLLDRNVKHYFQKVICTCKSEITVSESVELYIQMKYWKHG